MKRYLLILTIFLLLISQSYAGPLGSGPLGGSAGGGATADDTAYNAATWDNNLDAATKNAIRDKIETMAGGHNPVTIGTANGLSILVQDLSLAAATNATPGAATAAQITALESNTASRHAAVTLNATATAGGLSIVVQELAFRAATNAVSGYATPAQIQALEAATAAQHTQGTDTALGALGTKNPPIDADKLVYRDSTAADALVTSTFTQVKAFLKTYFDTLYQTILTNSAGLAGALSDESGTGLAVFNNSPTLIDPVLGDATATSVTIAGTTSGGQYVQLLEDTDNGAHYAGWGVYGDIVASYLLAPPLAVPTAGQMLVFAVPGNQTMSDGSSKSVAVGTWADPVTASSTTEFTNKTLDANDTGNVIKGYGYILLQKPNHFGAGVTQQTTATEVSYGQALFVDDTDKATNWVEYVCEVPRDIDVSVNLAAWFKFKLGDADTGDHEYEISMVSVAASAAYDGTPANAVSLGYSADASGADGDVEEASLTDLTDWESNVTAGNLWVIRVARDGDHANDTSTVDSYSGPLTIRYGFTQ